VLPNGDVLVTETNGAPRSDNACGPKGWVMNLITKRAGGGVPSANRTTLLRNEDKDGIAKTRTVFLSGPNSPFGMTLIGSDIYIPNQ
jgi:glucose/arabinose dehydrogenase